MIDQPWIALLIWVALYSSDYYLTLYGARLYRETAHAYIDMDGSYELEPLYKKDVDDLRRFSPRFLRQLLLTSVALLVLWWVTVRVTGFPEVFLVGFGAYLFTELAVHMRHARNIMLFRSLRAPGAAEGRIKYQRWLTERISRLELRSFAILFVICYAVSSRIIFLGAALGCLMTAQRHTQQSKRSRSQLRRATDADVSAVARIHVESWNVAYRGIMPDEIIARTDLGYRTKFWGERIADRDWPVFVIDENGQSVAFCQMIPTKDADDDPRQVGHITSLHVLPQLRGRGHGRALLDHVLAEFRRRGFAELTLWVLEANAPARRFYEKYGFKSDGGTRIDSHEVPEVRYRIRIS